MFVFCCLDYFHGKPEGKRPLGRSRSRWEDNIKTDQREMRLRVWI
jgi:hypothetical protein